MNITRTWKKRLALALSLLLFGLAGCQPAAESPPSGGASESSGASSGARGRFMEEALPIPSEGETIRMLELMPNGELLLLSAPESEGGISPMTLWRSDDFGTSWEQTSTPWLEELRDKALLFVHPSRSGDGFYLAYITREQLEEYTQKAQSEKEEGPNAIRFMPGTEESGEIAFPTAAFAYGDNSGLTLLPYTLPAGKYGSEPAGLKEAANGDLVLHNYFELVHLDGESGQVQETYEVEDYLTDGNFLISGDTLILCNADAITAYDLQSGLQSNLIGEPQETPNAVSRIIGRGLSRVITADEEEGAIYYCDSSGIYRALLDGVATERLVDGELTSLSMPSLSKQRIYYHDGSFLVYCVSETQGASLLRYVYDSTVPSVPTTELKVYSLSQDQTVRQAISSFQLQNPDVKITYTVGMADGSSVTPSDALRTLSTRLLAGDGPDILVLDGMPVDSYISRNVLMDLSGAFGSDIAAGVLLENIASAYLRGEGLYAVPARFSTSVLLADDDALAGIDSLASLADWIEANPGVKLSISLPDVLLEQFYDSCAPYWFAGDGSLDAEAFARSLSDISRVSQAEGKMNKDAAEGSISIGGSNLVFNTVMWAGGHSDLSVDPLQTLADLAVSDAAIKAKGRGGAELFTGGGVFAPPTILGVNTATAKTELALDFLRHTLSEDVLSNDFGDGMPVNTAALEAGALTPYEDGARTYYSYSIAISSSDGEEESDEPFFSSSLGINWPEKEFMDQFVTGVKKLSVPSNSNLVVRQMILDEARHYFDGSMSLDAVTDSLRQKLDLYQAEQR